MQQVGRFEVIRELGRGGMGVVYRARDPQLGRELALKLILETVADPEALLRFGREAQAMGRVSHPNLVRIYEVGRAPQGPYIAAELVEGEPLSARLKREGPLQPMEAARIVEELAGAVEALHQANLLHRDLKPDNVMLRPDGSPVLLDLGVARDESAEQLTRTGQLVGTPAYMSPEQASGATGRVRRSSDVYGLGAVLFAALTGRAPFAGETMLNLIAAVLHDEPAWPGPEQGVPLELAAVLRRAMAKEPMQRYRSAAELAADLGRVRRGERPIVAVVRFRRRWPRLATALTLPAALVVAAGLLLHDRAQPAETPPQEQAARPAPEAPRDPWAELPDDAAGAAAAIRSLATGAAQIEAAESWLRRGLASSGEGLDPVRAQLVDVKMSQVPRSFDYAHWGEQLKLAPADGDRLLIPRWWPAGNEERSALALWAVGGDLPAGDVPRLPAPERVALYAACWRPGHPLAALTGIDYARDVYVLYLAQLDPPGWFGAIDLPLPKGESGGPRSLCASDDGTLLAVGTHEAPSSFAVFRWEALLAAVGGGPAPQPVIARAGTREWESPLRMPVRRLAFSHDARALIVACGEKHDEQQRDQGNWVSGWEVATGERLWPSEAALQRPWRRGAPGKIVGEPRVLVLHPTRDQVLVGDAASNGLQLMSAKDGSWDGRWFVGEGARTYAGLPVGEPAHDGPPAGAAFAAGGRLLFSVAGQRDGTTGPWGNELRVWDVARRAELVPRRLTPDPHARLAGVLLTRDERWLVSSYAVGGRRPATRFEVWEMSLGPAPR